MFKSTAMPLFYVGWDGGNYAAKGVTNAFNGSTDARHTYRHAISQISRDAFDRAVNTRRGGQAGYYIINGTAYAVGDTALRYNPMIREGAARYTADYMTPLFAPMLYELLQVPEASVQVMATHSVLSFQYRDNLLNALEGQTYAVDGPAGRRVYTVDKVMTMDEGLASVFHHVLLHNLRERVETPIRNQNARTLVLDIGGLTSDGVGIHYTRQGFQVDTGAIGGAEIGMNHLEVLLNEHIRSQWSDLFIDQPAQLPLDMLSQALRTGVYPAGKHDLDVKDFVDQQFNYMISQIVDMINIKLGGLMTYRNLMVTGGGGALLLPRLQERFSRVNLFLADEKADNLMYCNASGALRLLRWINKGGK